MSESVFISLILPAMPFAVMLIGVVLSGFRRFSTARLWQTVQALCASGLFMALAAWVLASTAEGSVFASSGLASTPSEASWLLKATPISLLMASLVGLLGWVITAFSARYLEGEANQRRYLRSLAGVLASTHLLLLANHWLILIAAWALIGTALQHLLVFYPERPFARLAAHKKMIADRLADVFLLLAAGLAWAETGTGQIDQLVQIAQEQGMTAQLHLSAVCLVTAVILRTALLPVHGWLIQVMEAPTPVSALLHAGVVNLGGFVLIQFAPLLNQALPARAMLLVFGLGTAILAGMVMLTRISVKVRLAWSTVAQMGFLILECALGLYTLAALHLVGHSLYKVHAFLSASSAVRQARAHTLSGASPIVSSANDLASHTRASSTSNSVARSASPSAINLLMAPCATTAIVGGILWLTGSSPWPLWWTAILGLAWAPFMWLSPSLSGVVKGKLWLSGAAMTGGLTVAGWLLHKLPMGLTDTPHTMMGLISLAGFMALYVCLTILQTQPNKLSRWRRWSYAGFYVDEAYTRLALKVWPVRWVLPNPNQGRNKQPGNPLPASSR